MNIISEHSLYKLTSVLKSYSFNVNNHGVLENKDNESLQKYINTLHLNEKNI